MTMMMMMMMMMIMMMMFTLQNVDVTDGHDTHHGKFCVCEVSSMFDIECYVVKKGSQ